MVLFGQPGMFFSLKKHAGLAKQNHLQIFAGRHFLNNTYSI